MTSLESVLASASRRVLPTKEEERRLAELADFLMERTRAAARGHHEVKDVVMGGSFAKGTWLPANVDIDVFVIVDPSTSGEDFERIGLAVGTEAAKGFPSGKKYAQHPYVEALVRGVKVNVVPCYDVEPPNWKSAADRSPFHVKLVAKLPQNQKTEVRLLKSFMRAVGVYGAEIEVQGFSGYAAEVLTSRHGNLEGVLRCFEELKRSGNESLFTLPDPVDQTRDLAKAISNESAGRLVLAAREFLSRPSPAFFGLVGGRPRPEIRREVVALVFSHARLSEDTLWGELRRTLRHVTKALEERGFRMARTMAASNNSDSSAFLFVPEFGSLPHLEQHLGPTVERREETESFLAANRKKARLVWVDGDGRLRILQQRSHTELQRLLVDLARGKLGHIGASRDVGVGMARTSRVVRGPSLGHLPRSKGWLDRAVHEIASDTFGTRPA